MPPPASHVLVALLQSLQNEFSCLVQEQRNSNFSLARMELRMASLEDELRRLSNRVDLLLESGSYGVQGNQIQQEIQAVPQPILVKPIF